MLCDTIHCHGLTIGSSSGHPEPISLNSAVSAIVIIKNLTQSPDVILPGPGNYH